MAKGTAAVQHVAMRLLVLVALLVPQHLQAATPSRGCAPTPADEIGPFYRPKAPLRTQIGRGYVLEGTVRSTDCRPIPKARIEVWQAGPNGSYDDQHRATLYSDRQGRYRLETDFPPPYARRPSHIHILVDVAGFAGLITQHYPVPGTRRARLDLVLPPE